MAMTSITTFIVIETVIKNEDPIRHLPSIKFRYFKFNNVLTLFLFVYFSICKYLFPNNKKPSSPVLRGEVFLISKKVNSGIT